MTRLRLRRIRIARSWGEATLMLIRRGTFPRLTAETARIAATWALRALEGR